MNFRPSTSATAILAGLALLSLPLAAQTVNMDLQNVSPQATVAGRAGTSQFSDNYTGLVHFTVSSSTPSNFVPRGTTLDLFCVELSQSIGLPSSTQFSLLSAKFADMGANTGLGANIPVGGIGADRARNLEILYHNVFGSTYNPGSLSSERKVAFQVAVWELSHDTNFNLTTASTNGFWVTSLGAPYGGALSIAQGWVSVVGSQTLDPNAARMALSVLHNDSKQDFLLPDSSFSVIPEPSACAAMMGGLLVAGVMLRNRWRILSVA